MFSGKPLACHLLLTSFRLSCLYVSVKTWITDPSSGFCLVKKKHPFILATSFISPFISPFFVSHGFHSQTLPSVFSFIFYL